MSSGVLKHGETRIPVSDGSSHAEENNRLMVVIAILLFLSFAIAVIAIFMYVVQLASSVAASSAPFDGMKIERSTTQSEGSTTTSTSVSSQSASQSSRTSISITQKESN